MPVLYKDNAYHQIVPNMKASTATISTVTKNIVYLWVFIAVVCICYLTVESTDNMPLKILSGYVILEFVSMRVGSAYTLIFFFTQKTLTCSYNRITMFYVTHRARKKWKMNLWISKESKYL